MINAYIWPRIHSNQHGAIHLIKKRNFIRAGFNPFQVIVHFFTPWKHNTTGIEMKMTHNGLNVVNNLRIWRNFENLANG